MAFIFSRNINTDFTFDLDVIKNSNIHIHHKPRIKLVFVSRLINKLYKCAQLVLDTWISWPSIRPCFPVYLERRNTSARRYVRIHLIERPNTGKRESFSSPVGFWRGACVCRSSYRYVPNGTLFLKSTCRSLIRFRACGSTVPNDLIIHNSFCKRDVVRFCIYDMGNYTCMWSRNDIKPVENFCRKCQNCTAHLAKLRATKEMPRDCVSGLAHTGQLDLVVESEFHRLQPSFSKQFVMWICRGRTWNLQIRSDADAIGRHRRHWSPQRGWSSLYTSPEKQGKTINYLPNFMRGRMTLPDWAKPWWICGPKCV